MNQVWAGVRGKRVVLTGATSGIGLAAARRLATLGAELTIVARNPERGAAAAAQIGAAGPAPDVLFADLESQAAVRRLADDIRGRYARLDVLINNAGALYATRQLTEDGVERTWALNQVAAFLLTTRLLDLLESSAPARIITTSSGMHQSAHIPFDDLTAAHSYPGMGMGRYGETKLANILFTTELARRLGGTGVTANCFHPGFVGSRFGLNNGGLLGVGMRLAHVFARTPEKGAETLVWLADSPDVDGVSGAYFVDRRRVTPSPAAQDPEAARRLWQVTEELVAVRV